MSKDAPKHLVTSKTVLVNLIIALAPLIPGAVEFVQANTTLVMSAIGVAGIALRWITKGRVVLFPDS